MIRTEIFKKLQHAIVITENDLVGLNKLISDHFKIDSYEIECSDESNIRFSSHDELLGYENPNSRKILSLTIQFSDKSGASSSRGRLRIDSNNASSSPITFFVREDTERSRADTVANEIEKRMHDLKPWYSIFAKCQIEPWSYAILFGLAFVILWYSSIELINNGESLSLPSIPNFIAGILFWVIVIVIIHNFAKGWRWLFPLVSFSLGMQVQEMKRCSLVRNWIFGSLITAIVIALFLG